MTAQPLFAVVRALGLVLGLFLVLGLAMPASAQSLESLRAAGAVGERFDGYLELRNPNAGGAAALVEQVNGERRRIYETDAAAQGISPQEVGRVYATKIWEKVPPGTWLLNEGGSWRQK